MHLCRAQSDPRAESGATAPAARRSTSRTWTSSWPSPGSAAPCASGIDRQGRREAARLRRDLLRADLELVGVTRQHLHWLAALTEDGRARRDVVLPEYPGPGSADAVADVELIAGVRARQGPDDRERQTGGVGVERGADLDHAVHAAGRRAMDLAVVVVGAGRGGDREVDRGRRGGARV